MPSRRKIIRTIDVDERYITSNIEKDEFSYVQALNKEIKGHKFLDIRFEKTNDTSVLIETKAKKFTDGDIQQLFDYVKLEQEYKPNHNIVAILASTTSDDIKVWYISKDNTEYTESDDEVLKTMEEYIDYFKPKKKNDKESVITNTLELNDKLHDNGIDEALRSQFVGSCLLALKNGLHYHEEMSTEAILTDIGKKLDASLPSNPNKAEKLKILRYSILENPHIRTLKSANLVKLLNYIKDKILPYINEDSNEGQDLLSLFFTTFNKYVGKADKNQAFTPNHIVHFMCSIARIYSNTHVLDPTCGSGSFLVQAMTMALKDCHTEAEKNKVKSENIYGIEIEEKAFGLATTNMLIHGDGNTNIINKSCFDTDIIEWIQKAKIQVVLMNPPYNASRRYVPEDYAKTWGNSITDPSKGFYFVQQIADLVKENNGKLLTLLPMQCAIGSSSVITEFKRKMLSRHTLDAVFSLPPNIFYPGANANVCCMVFTLNQKHPEDHKTFFGYYNDDGFQTRKGAGRVDVNNRWKDIEKEWLDLYRERIQKLGKSITRHVSYDDEWLAEAYMETNYADLSKANFQKTLNHYIAYKTIIKEIQDKSNIDVSNWKTFQLAGDKGIFRIESCKCSNAGELLEEGNDIEYIGAKKSNNGLMSFVKYNSSLVTRGNCIIFICDGQGSVGYANYIDHDFIGSTTLSVGYNDNLNPQIGLFIVTVLDLERYRYSFGRKYKTNLSKAVIKLPSTSDGEPDWKYMENFIKSLQDNSSTSKI